MIEIHKEMKFKEEEMKRIFKMKKLSTNKINWGKRNLPGKSWWDRKTI